MEGDIKLRSVCDACTSAKLRCNGKTPCERCLKKGIECHYQPFKNRSGGGSGGKSGPSSNKLKANDKPPDALDSFLDDYERKSWNVFFTLYRSFGKGCSLYWFKQQLFRMMKFLETKSLMEASAAHGFVRLKSWMIALGIDINSPPLDIGRIVPRMQFPGPPKPAQFEGTLEDMKADALKRDLPMLQVTTSQQVVVNDAFNRMFDVTQEDLQHVMDETGGGFLPWSGDLMARILSRESDLVQYIQGASNTLDALGRPAIIPHVHIVPSMSVVRVLTKGRREVLCIVRAVQIMHLESVDYLNSSTIVFDISDDNQSASSKTRPFSETSMAADEDHGSKKLLGTPLDDAEDILPLPHEILSTTSNDDEWLEGLLTWASEDIVGGDLGHLPIADDIDHLNIHHEYHKV